MDPNAETMGKLFSKAGYDTGYIGKWHVNANGRSSPIPVDRQHGFKYWKALECSHDYNTSHYFEGSSTEMKTWEGYDAIAQTNDAISFIKSRDKDSPFLLTLSWGPPHDPYETAPQQYLDLIDEDTIVLRGNVPANEADKARTLLKGYYAHILALDECLNSLMEALDEESLADDTILVFWSDHGDMLLSHGELFKQRPWEESIRVPLLIRFPRRFGPKGKQPPTFINTPDILPTLLGLCDIDIPESIDGTDYSTYISEYITASDSPVSPANETKAPADCALLACQSPFGQFTREVGGREYRGLRTSRYTYVSDLDGPWLLYDNDNDPYQLTNLAKDDTKNELIKELDTQLSQKLTQHDDALLPGIELLKKFHYADDVDETGTMPFFDEWNPA